MKTSRKTRRRPEPREDTVVAAVMQFLGGSGYRVRTEVSSLGQSADIIATRGRWITAVEVKVGNRQRALQQCRAHEVIADFVVVAIGATSISSTFRALATASGYGIIRVDPGGAACDWALAPRRSRRVWKPERLRFSSRLRAVRYAG